MLFGEYSYEEDIRTQRTEVAASDLIQAVSNLRKNLGLTVPKALSALGKTQAEYDSALALFPVMQENDSK